jgi:hypothetical protein
MRITKNISKGDQITSMDMLVTLSRQGKSVVIAFGAWHKVLPAAFVIGMPLRTVLNYSIFFAINHNEAQSN